MRRRIPPKIIAKSNASVNENVLTGIDIDVTRFPAPKFWPGDGGRYIGTGDITLTRDPATRRINVGCYRQMVQSRDRVSLYCSPGKHGRLDREAWWQRGESCEVVAAYGVDPVLFMVSAQVFGAGDSEFDTAGGIMGSGIELTQAEFVDLPIPAHCEIAIEGVLRPGEFMPEGPLGEFTGYYGGTPGPQPVIEIKAVHHRRDPVLTAALMATYPSCDPPASGTISRPSGSRGLRESMRIRRRRPAGAWWSYRCASSMPVMSPRCWRSRRNARRPPITPSGSSRWTTTSIRPTSIR
jgi:4-hydroxy-3-polyprenylbenzoate decarboxylase